MSWFSLALLSMLAKSAQNFAEKKSQSQLGSFLTMFLLLVISVIIVTPIVLIASELPSVNLAFWFGVLGSVLIYLVAKPMRLFALGTGDLSEIVPLVSFSSLFSVTFGWIFLGEIPSSWGLFGVCLIALGGYFMNYDVTQIGRLNKVAHPIKRIFRNKTQSYLFLSLILGPISSVFDKLAINNTVPRSPHFVFLTENLILIPLIIPILFLRKVSFASLKSRRAFLTPALLGVFYTAANLFAFSAISVGNIGYVAAIKQLSSLLAVFAGYYILKEGQLSKRLVSAIVMGIGAFFVGYLG